MKQSHDFFKKRIKIFRKRFSLFEVDGFLIDNATDIFYFTGVKLSSGILFVSQKGIALCVDGRYMEMAKKFSPFSVISIQESSLERLWFSSQWIGVLTIGFDINTSFAMHRKFKRFFLKLKRKLKPCDHPIQKQRAIKDKEELSHLSKSAVLLWKGFLYIKKILKKGMTEKEVAFLFEWYCKKNGAEGLSFEPIIAFGENSSLPHHYSGDRKLKDGDVVLIDIGVVVNRYMSDMTRMVFFGKVSKEIRELFLIVQRAYEEVLPHIKPGVEVGQLDRIVRQIMGHKEKFFLHSLGHGIGLSIHEYPFIGEKSQKTQLEEGMVITIEPGLYLPGIGGVRHEDMIVVTHTGSQNLLTNSIH